MSELRLLIGLPASGKTSYAFNLIATEPDWIRINWDEDRIFHGLHLKKFDRKAEEQMQKGSFVRAEEAAAREGFHVCGHVHDEIITEGLDNPFELDYKDLQEVL